MFAFETGPLVRAGEYAVTAGYCEQRPELCQAVSKKEANLRTHASAFEVGPQHQLSPISALRDVPCVALELLASKGLPCVRTHVNTPCRGFQK